MGTQSIGERTITQAADVNDGSTRWPAQNEQRSQWVRNGVGGTARTLSSTLRRAAVTSMARSAHRSPCFLGNEGDKNYGRNRIRQRLSNNCVDQ